MPNGPLWVVEFDYRDDDGPDRVGPFRSRPAAGRWVEAQPINEASYSIVRLWMPPEKDRA